MIIRNIIKEWRIWRTVRKIVKENKSKFEALGFDVDWIGRVWCIINIPDEITSTPIRTRKDQVLQNIEIDTYIKSGLDDVAKLFTELCLSDLIMYPLNYERFNGTDSILLVLCPERKYTKPWVILLYFLGLFGIIAGMVFLILFLITLI